MKKIIASLISGFLCQNVHSSEQPVIKKHKPNPQTENYLSVVSTAKPIQELVASYITIYKPLMKIGNSNSLALIFTPNGKYIASTSKDGKTTVWNFEAYLDVSLKFKCTYNDNFNPTFNQYAKQIKPTPNNMLQQLLRGEVISTRDLVPLVDTSLPYIILFNPKIRLLCFTVCVLCMITMREKCTILNQ